MKVSSEVLLVVAIIFILTSDENGSKLTTVQGRTAWFDSDARLLQPVEPRQQICSSRDFITVLELIFDQL